MPLMAKEDDLVKLGLRIRDLRIEKNITQAQLAHSIGKDQQSIAKIETGKFNPSFYYLKEIAAGLQISVADLLQGL